jgi:hypothetical protein
VLDAVLGTLAGVVSSSLFVLALVVGFCVLFGLVKLRQTAGRGSVVKSLDETLTHLPVTYFSADTPHGPVDQLHTPELVEAAARKS